MTFAQAQAHLDAGRSVRRADWYTSISRASGGTIAWNISDDLARSCSMSGRNADKIYRPHETDEVATDWLVVDAAQVAA